MRLIVEKSFVIMHATMKSDHFKYPLALSNVILNWNKYEFKLKLPIIIYALYLPYFLNVLMSTRSSYSHNVLSIPTHVSWIVTNAKNLLEMEVSNSIHDITHRSLQFKLVP